MIIVNDATFLLMFLLVVATFSGSITAQISLGSKLLAKEKQAWVSDNGTFAFGFTGDGDDSDGFQLGIWFAQLPGDPTLVWSAYL